MRVAARQSAHFSISLPFWSVGMELVPVFSPDLPVFRLYDEHLSICYSSLFSKIKAWPAQVIAVEHSGGNIFSVILCEHFISA